MDKYNNPNLPKLQEVGSKISRFAPRPIQLAARGTSNFWHPDCTEFVQSQYQSARVRPDLRPVPKSTEGLGQAEAYPPATRSWRGVHADKGQLLGCPPLPYLC